MAGERPGDTAGAGGWRAVLGWLVLVGALAWGLGSYPLLDPDEGRNSEVAREMAASGDFGLPRLDGLPYLDKPVGYFAVDALAQRVLGANETAARLPSFVFALMTAGLTGWFAGRVLGRGARWIAALAALAAPLPLAFARTVIFDTMLAFFLVLALVAFWLAVEARRGGRGYLGWTALAWAAIGVGILTKGPVALAVPLLAAVPYAVWRRASRAVWHPAGILAMAVVVGPWIWWMSVQVPEFLHYALVIETWQRVATPAMHREGPIWLYIPCLLAGTLPWSVLVLAGWRRSLRWRAAAGRLDPLTLYLLLWIALPFVMFSLSHSKRPQYILPLLPAVALLAARAWVTGGAGAREESPGSAGSAGEKAGDSAESTGTEGTVAERAAGAQESETTGATDLDALPGRRAAAVTWFVLAVLAAAAAPVVARSHARAMPHSALLPPTLLALAAVFLAGGALVALANRRSQAIRQASPEPRQAARTGRSGRWRREVLVLGLVLPIAALPAIALPLLGETGRHRSSRAAAAAIAPLLGPGAAVVGVRAFPPSLPFYLRRTILVASPRGRELTSNYVIAYFQKWLAADPAHTPLRPLTWWPGALAACSQPLVFIAWTDDTATRAALASSGLPLIVANDRMAAYGPCAAPPHR